MKTIPTIAIIGAGNMGSSLIGGLVKHGHPATEIYASDPNEDKLRSLRERFAVQTCRDNATAIEKANIVIFAVKPPDMGEIVRALSKSIKKHRPLLISIAAGIPIKCIHQHAGEDASIIRCMPNTPALLGAGATALYANANVTDEERKMAETILRTVGMIVWIQDEKQMDTVTALSGSGPAYFFMFMEALEEAAIELGLTADIANALVTQTALGAAKMATEKHMSLKDLRLQVTSKGGTTERALTVLEENNMRQILKKAIVAAQTRSEELASLYGEM